MDNPGEILRLCRLCLVKDQVNIPIFEEGDIRQIFLKISSCLPVKVSSDDKLPKKICDGCSNKLDLFYEFWNTSANAEKTLLSWLGQAGVKDADETISAVAQQIAKPAETQVKQEALEDGHANQVQDSFTSQSFEEEAKDESEAPPPKRARRTAAVKAQINITPESDDDDDMDNAEAMTKVEDESEESDGEDKDPSYSEVPGTSADDQAGPSGVGKDGVEAPKVNVDFSNLIFTCFECEFVFSSQRLLRDHQKTCLKKKGNKNDIFFCNYCPKLFNDRFRFEQHMLYHNNRLMNFNCHQCRKSFDNRNRLSKHMLTFHKEMGINFSQSQEGSGISKKILIVPRREKIFVAQGSLSAHVLKKQKFRVDQITSKGASVVINKSQLHNQANSVHHEPLVPQNCGLTIIDNTDAVETVSCPQCEKVFDKKSSLNDHVIEDHKPLGEANEEVVRNYRCQECNISFDKHATLFRHVKVCHRLMENIVRTSTDSAREGYLCPECGKFFEKTGSLKSHYVTCHLCEQTKRVTCKECHKSFSGYSIKSHIERMHKNIEHNKRPFCCDKCGKEFRARLSLKIHMARVHGEGEDVIFPCNEAGCSKVFKDSVACKYHMFAAHSKEKTEKVCEHCGKSFVNPMLFKVHLRKHRNGPKSYACTKCEKTMTSKHSLRDHMKIHSGEKSFVCEQCGQCFTRYSTLRVHRVVHTKEKPHVCKSCNKSYTQRSPLSRHIRLCHPEMANEEVTNEKLMCKNGGNDDKGTDDFTDQK